MNRKESHFTNYDWNPENLNKLLENSNQSMKNIAAGAGISEAAFYKYLRSENKPGVNALIKLADYFNVSVDYILGRSEDSSDSILKESAKKLFDRNKAAYETLAFVKGQKIKIPCGYDAPYPYNLLDDIFQEPFDHILSDDEENGLNKAIRTLTPKEQIAIQNKYMNYYSLEEVGREFGVLRERARQIIAKAIRKLRHPSRINLIRYGYDGYSIKQELDERKRKLDEKERYLNAAANALEDEKEKLQRDLSVSLTADLYDIPKGNAPSQAFIDLELDTRTYNCLLQARINSVEKIVRASKQGSILKVRNFGIKCRNALYDSMLKNQNINLYELEGSEGDSH